MEIELCWIPVCKRVSAKVSVDKNLPCIGIKISFSLACNCPCPKSTAWSFLDDLLNKWILLISLFDLSSLWCMEYNSKLYNNKIEPDTVAFRVSRTGDFVCWLFFFFLLPSLISLVLYLIWIYYDNTQADTNLLCWSY